MIPLWFVSCVTKKDYNDNTVANNCNTYPEESGSITLNPTAEFVGQTDEVSSVAVSVSLLADVNCRVLMEFSIDGVNWGHSYSVEVPAQDAGGIGGCKPPKN
jgi:hypothetical protein